MIQQRLSIHLSERVVAGMTRETVVRRLRPKVRAIAYEACRGRPVGAMDLDDLVSCGMVGLLQAFDRYDPDCGTRFGSYAKIRIRGAILDAMRSQDPLSRRRRGLARQLAAATAHVEHHTGRGASAREVAGAMGLDLVDYWRAVDRTRSVTVTSLDRSESGEEGRPLAEKVSSESLPDAESLLEHTEVRRALRQVIDGLPERTRECVERYYLHDEPQTDIARDLGVTVSRVSQILSSARATLRKRLEPVVDVGVLR